MKNSPTYEKCHRHKVINITVINWICWSGRMIFGSLAVNRIKAISICWAFILHFTFIHFDDFLAFTIFILFKPWMANTMKFCIWQCKTIRWSSAGIIGTNIASIINSINSTNRIISTKIGARWTFAICSNDFQTRDAVPFGIIFVLATKTL